MPTRGQRPKAARRDLAEVNKAWERVAQGVKDLKPRENLYFLRRAEAVDAILDRLHRQLGVEGERPQLIIRT